MNRVNLMLHCGGALAQLDEIARVHTPTPVDRWHPIPHITLIERVQGALTNTGLVVQNEAHALSHKGARYFGLMQLGPKDEEQKDHALVVGIRNSHDKAFGAKLGVGSGVFVCDNLSFSSDIVIGRKHTRFINRDLPGLVNRAVAQLTAHRGKQEKRFEAYKTFEVTDALADHLICEMFRTGVLSTQKIGPVLTEWKNPRHPEFKEKTAWRLFNSTTEHLKGRLGSIQRETMTLHGILDKATGVYGTMPLAA